MPSTSTPPAPLHTSPTSLTSPTAGKAPYSPIDSTMDNATLPQHQHQPETLHSVSSHGHDAEKADQNPLHHAPRKALWARFRGKGRKPVGVLASLKAIALSSWLNSFIVFIPLAWLSHFDKLGPKNDPLTFALCFLSTISLEALIDFGGEQMALYCGKDLGDLVVITLNNAIEATLAIILLTKCKLKLLQSTIAGVVLLHLLLVPGTAFITGGAHIWEQNLHPHPTQLNHALLTIGVLALLVPAAFFSALNPGAAANATAAAAAANDTQPGAEPFITDSLRGDLLSMSRGMAVILLLVYICSRIFLYNPPGDGNALQVAPNAPAEIHRIEHELAHEKPKVGPWTCLGFLIVTVGVMAATAEWLVDSIEFIQESRNITEEWFGVVLLPLVSFSGDATVAIAFFIRAACYLKPETPATLARARAIDLSIQFTLFWMPFLVLLAWWTNKPLTLLFDLYEVALLIGACFLVNYVTADAKTNWAEGVILCAFYIMIALVSWYYAGQIEVQEMMSCTTVAEALAKAAEGEIGGIGE